MIPLQRTTARIALAMAFAALAVSLGFLAMRARFALSFPYAFDYGEGVVWQQMHDIVQGRGYRPIGLERAVAYEYPPVYHVATWYLADWTGTAELRAGRLLSLVSGCFCALFVGTLTWRMAREEPAPVRHGAAMLAALIFAAVPMFATWSLLMRIDLLAYALTALGMVLAGHAVKSLPAALAAGVVFALALYTRQTSLPAPAAAFAVLLLARPSRAWAMAGAAVLTGLPALLWLEQATHGGFLLNIVSYNVNRIIWEHALALAGALLASVVPIAIAAIGARAAIRAAGVGHWREWRAAAAERTTLMIVLAMLALKTLLMPAILKSGASDNYLIEWFIPVCALAGLGALPLLRAALGQSGPSVPMLSALFAIGLPIYVWGGVSTADAARLAGQRQGLDRIVALVRSSPKPVLTDDPTLLIRAGKALRWETAIIAEMASYDRFDERGFVDKIRHGDFAFVVTDGERGDLLFDQRFNPAVSDGIDAAYPCKLHLGGRTVHFMRAGGTGRSARCPRPAT